MASDDGLFRRVAITSLVVTVIVFGGLAAYFPWTVSVSFALGAATGIASLGTLDAMVRGLVATEAARRKRRLWLSGFLHVGKYGLIAAGLYLLFSIGAASAPALAAGVTLPTAVLCLKEAGGRLNAKMGVEEGQPSQTDE